MKRVTRQPGPAYDEQIEFDKLENRITQLESEIERYRDALLEHAEYNMNGEPLNWEAEALGSKQ